MGKKVDGHLKNNILIILLRTFSDNEWKEFEKFVRSPFFNRGRNYMPFLGILKKFRPGFDSDNFSKKEIYKKLYPGKEYKESVLKTMLSRLNDIAEDFIYQVSLSKNDILLRERFLLKEISKRGLKLRAEKIIRETNKLIERKKTGILDYTWRKDYTNEVLNHYHNFNERSMQTKYVFEYQLFNIYSYLTEYLITEGLVYSQKIFWSNELNKKEVFGIFDSFDFEKILNAIKKTDIKKFEVLNIFYLLRMSFKHPDKDIYYFDLKKAVFAIIESTDLDFKKYFFNALTVICSSKTQYGKEEFRKEAFDLRKRIYDENLNIFSDEHYLKNGDFRTAFVEAISLKELKWAEDFSMKYLEKVQPEYREDLSSYCKAWLNYLNNNYDESLHYAMRVNINQITYKLDMKNLISKIYYETESTENLISHLNTCYQLIKNSNSQSKIFLTRNLNFIRYLRKLINLKLARSCDPELRVLRDNIEKDNVTSKSWLIKKIDEAI